MSDGGDALIRRAAAAMGEGRRLVDESRRAQDRCTSTRAETAALRGPLRVAPADSARLSVRSWHLRGADGPPEPE
jgi:hypothetical protein